MRRRSPSPATSRKGRLPPRALQPAQKAPFPPSPPVPGPVPHAAGPPGPSRAPPREDPGRASAGKSGASPALFMVATPPGWGTVVSGFSGGSTGVTLQLAASDAGPAARSPSAGKGEPARWRRRAEARRNGVRGGTKLPLALLSQRRVGWPRPGEGRPGALTTRRRPPAPPPHLRAARAGPTRRRPPGPLGCRCLAAGVAERFRAGPRARILWPWGLDPASLSRSLQGARGSGRS